MGDKSKKSDSKSSKGDVKKLDPKVAVPIDKFDSAKVSFVKIDEGKIPGDKGDYKSVMKEYDYGDQGKGDQRIKWYLKDCYVGSFEDEEKDMVTWSVTAYFNPIDEDGSPDDKDVVPGKKLMGYLEEVKIADLQILDEVKEKLDGVGPDYSESNFNPEDGKPSELFEWIVKKPKKNPKNRKIKFKVTPKGAKPTIKMVITPKMLENEVIKKFYEKSSSKREIKNKKGDLIGYMINIDASDIEGKRCTFELTSSHPSIYVGTKIFPQNHFYSAMLVAFDADSKAPDDFYDDDAAEMLESKADKLEALATKVAAIGAPKPSEAKEKKKFEKEEKKGSKGKKDDEKDGEIHSKVRDKLKDLRSKTKDEKAKKDAKESATSEEKKSPKNDD